MNQVGTSENDILVTIQIVSANQCVGLSLIEEENSIQTTALNSIVFEETAVKKVDKYLRLNEIACKITVVLAYMRP